MKLDNHNHIVKTSFGRAAQQYEKTAVVQQGALKTLLDWVRISDVHPEQILDIGCGPGNSTRALAQHFLLADVHGFDLSEEMIAYATSIQEGRPVQYRVDNGETFEDDQHYDILFSNATLQWFKDPLASVLRMKRFLNPNGVLFFSWFGPDTFKELSLVLSELIEQTVLLPSSGFPVPDIFEQMLTPHFSSVEIKQERVIHPFDSLKSLLTYIKHTGTRGQGASVPLMWTPTFFKQVEEAYLDKYRGIPATFQIFYCRVHV